jgi:hypothetical protein
MYCLCVNVYCTAATVCQPNCSKQIYHIYHIIISYHISYIYYTSYIISYISHHHIISYIIYILYIIYNIMYHIIISYPISYIIYILYTINHIIYHRTAWGWPRHIETCRSYGKLFVKSVILTFVHSSILQCEQFQHYSKRCFLTLSKHITLLYIDKSVNVEVYCNNGRKHINTLYWFQAPIKLCAFSSHSWAC